MRQEGVVRVNSILPPGVSWRDIAPLFLLGNLGRTGWDSRPKMAYTHLLRQCRLGGLVIRPG
jgi:hypothetical protein